MTASFHAIVAGYLAYKSLFCNDNHNLEESIFYQNNCLMDKPNQLKMSLICISTGYCIFDIYINMFVIYKGKMTGEVKEYLLHHFIGLIGAVGVLWEGSFNITLACATLLSVLTDIPMNIRWYFLVTKKSNHPFYLPNDFVFLLSFFFLRVVLIFFLIKRNIDAHNLFVD